MLFTSTKIPFVHKRTRMPVASMAIVCCFHLGIASHQQIATAQAVQTGPSRASEGEIVERLERTEWLLQQTQDELQSLKKRDALRREWEQSVIERLPPREPDYEYIAPYGSAGSLTSHAATDSAFAGDSDESCRWGCFGTCTCLFGKRPGEITFKPGLRLQPRYTYDGETHNHDFFIRRFRLKGGGEVYDVAHYYAELKIDSTKKFGGDVNPSAVVENAWLDFPLYEDYVFLHVGLYDIPFSRKA